MIEAGNVPGFKVTARFAFLCPQNSSLRTVLEEASSWATIVEQFLVSPDEVLDAIKNSLKLAAEVFKRPEEAQIHFEAFQAACDEVVFLLFTISFCFTDHRQY